MDIVQLRYAQMSETQIARCSALSFDNGYMRGLLERERRLAENEQPPLGWIFLAQETNVLGWCFVDFHLWCFESRARVAGAHVYVDKPWRRQGIGRQLVEQAQLLDPDITVFPYDQPSLSFYCNVGLAEQVNARDIVSETAIEDAEQRRWQAIADRHQAGVQHHTSVVERP